MLMLSREENLKIVSPNERKDIYNNIQRLYSELVEHVAHNDEVTEIDIMKLLAIIKSYLDEHKDSTQVLGISTSKMVERILKDLDCFLPENTAKQRNVTINILRSMRYHALRYERAMASHKREQARIFNEKYGE